MFQNLKQKVKHWLAAIFAALFNCVCEPSIEREFAMLEDYLRIQELRRAEEARFRAIYWGARV